MINNPIDKLRVKTVSETLNPFKPKKMKPTPITDIQLKKLHRLSEEMDSLIIKKVKKDLPQAQWNALSELLRDELHAFITLSNYRLKFTVKNKIELFRILEEL